jgi:hypothetical protein
VETEPNCKKIEDCPLPGYLCVKAVPHPNKKYTKKETPGTTSNLIRDSIQKQIMISITRLSGKIYPDLTFAVGIVPAKKKRQEDDEYDRDIESTYDSYTETYTKYGQRKKRDVKFIADQPDLRRFIKGQQSSRTLKTYGNKGITKYGKKSTSCFGAILEKNYRRGTIGFGTATIPGYNHDTLRAIGSQWGEIVRRFFQKLRRSCEKKNRTFIYYGVSEIQEKRYKRERIPVPHLHFGYICRDKPGSEFYFTAKQARRFWEQSIIESLSRIGIALTGKGVINYNASIDVQIVKKSVRAYMSKYLTKGVATIEKMVNDGHGEYLPKQWWFACMQMKQMLKNNTVRATQEECASFFYEIEKLLHTCKVEWCNFVDVEVSPGEYRIFGIVGRLTKKFYKTFEDRIVKCDYAKALNYGNN